MAGVKNQDTQQPKRAPITIGGYPQAALDMMRARHPDYDQVMGGGNQVMGGGNQVMQGAQQGGIPAVAAQPMNMNVFQQNGGATGKFETPAVMPQPDLTPDTPAPAPEYGTDGVQFTNPAQTQQNDLSSLSSALTGAGVSRQAPEFQADPSQRDGGFFGWLGKLIPKNRPGMREGETPVEYDRRMTTNRENIAAFADAIRHMANIVNTSKGAPLQQFNDPTAMMEQGYQNRKAQRQREAAAASDAAYKQAEFDLENRKAQADKVYKEYLMGLRGENAQLAKDKFDYRRDKDAASAQYKQEQDKQKQDNWERQFKFREQQAAISNGLRQQSINKRGSGRSGGSGGGHGSTGGYSLYNPKTGQTEHFKNEKSWISRAAELGYKTDTPSSSTTSQEVYSRGGIKKVSNTTRGNSIATQIGKQTAQKKAAAKAAAQKKAAPKGSGGGKPTQKSKNGYKNTKKLGL